MMYILEGQVEVTVRLQIPRDGSSLRYSLTCLLAHSLVFSLAHSLTTQLVSELARWLIPHSLTHSLNHSLTHSLTHVIFWSLTQCHVLLLRLFSAPSVYPMRWAHHAGKPSLVNINNCFLEVFTVSACVHILLSDKGFVYYRTIHSRHHSRPTEHDKEDDTRSEASNRQPKGDIIGDDLPSALIEVSLRSR